MKSAVAKSHRSGVDVKAKVGSELIGMLDQMFQLYYQEYKQNFIINSLCKQYTYLQEVLGFSVETQISTPTATNWAGDESSDEE